MIKLYDDFRVRRINSVRLVTVNDHEFNIFVNGEKAKWLFFPKKSSVQARKEALAEVDRICAIGDQHDQSV